MNTSNVRVELRNSRFKRVLLAGLVFQSVAIGGAYATGRESVEYAAKYGTSGWMSVASTFVLLSLFAFVVFELCRKYQIFDYRQLVKLLIGRAYFLYDILYLLLGTTIVGVLISAAGNIMDDTLGVPIWVTSIGLVVIVAIVLFYGQSLMEKFNSIGTVLLTLSFVLFAVLVYVARSDDLIDVFTSERTAAASGSVAWGSVSAGLIYGSLFLCIFPSTLPVVRFENRRSDSVWGAFNLGWLVAVPLLLTYFALMSFYPDSRVMDSPIPWLSMLSQYGNWVVLIFGVVVGWTLIATAVGMIQGSLMRISANLEDAGRKPLSGWSRSVVAATVLVVAILISQLGIIDLVATAYTWGAAGMLVIFGIPLLTRGVYLIFYGKEFSGVEESDTDDDPRASSDILPR